MSIIRNRGIRPPLCYQLISLSPHTFSTVSCLGLQGNKSEMKLKFSKWVLIKFYFPIAGITNISLWALPYYFLFFPVFFFFLRRTIFIQCSVIACPFITLCEDFTTSLKLMILKIHWNQREYDYRHLTPIPTLSWKVNLHKIQFLAEVLIRFSSRSKRKFACKMNTHYNKCYF